MKKILTFISLFLLLIFQTTAGQYIRIFNILPNYMLTFAVVYSVSNQYTNAAFFGAVCGLMIDFSAPGTPFGMSTLMMMYISLVSAYLSNKLYYDNIWISSAFVFVVTLVYEYLYLFLTAGIFGETAMLYSLLRYIIPEAVINTLFSLILRIWINWLKNEYIRGI